jgi:hypothetical protein
MAHLADAEMVGADRLRRVIAEDNPTLVVYDEKTWAANLDYHRRSVSQALETFRHARAANYQLLKDLPVAVFARTGAHTKMGAFSVCDWIEIYSRHAKDHARQNERNREQFRRSKR